MKINDGIVNYEANRQLTETVSGLAGKAEEKNLSNEQKVNEENKLKQDVIVDISQASKEAQKIKEIILSEPDIREDKVAGLKEKIDSGKYIVNYGRVADKMVDALLDEIL